MNCLLEQSLQISNQDNVSALKLLVEATKTLQEKVIKESLESRIQERERILREARDENVKPENFISWLDVKYRNEFMIINNGIQASFLETPCADPDGECYYKEIRYKQQTEVCVHRFDIDNNFYCDYCVESTELQTSLEEKMLKSYVATFN